jgi:hypothetical protein
MLAHVNTSGQHIALWLDGDNSAMGWGQSGDYPYQEGSFFGNIFVSPPAPYYCNGKDFDQGVVAGRLGANSGAPYINPYGSTQLCSTFCSAHGSDGFNSCPTYNPSTSYPHIITVWRNFDPGTQYKICNKMSAKCLDMNGSTSDNAVAVQRGYSGASSQKWTVAETSAGKYRLVNIQSSKALSLSGGRTSDGTSLVQLGYSGSSSQIWSITSMGDGSGIYKLTSSASSGEGASLPVNGQYNDGTTVQISTYGGSDSQKWYVTVAN